MPFNAHIGFNALTGTNLSPGHVICPGTLILMLPTRGSAYTILSKMYDSNPLRDNLMGLLDLMGLMDLPAKSDTVQPDLSRTRKACTQSSHACILLMCILNTWTRDLPNNWSSLDS